MRNEFMFEDYKIPRRIGRSHLTLLVSVDPEDVQSRASAHRRCGQSVAGLTLGSDLREHGEHSLQSVNSWHAGAEWANSFVVLSDGWSLGSEAIAPTMKVRCSAVSDRHAKQTDSVDHWADIKEREAATAREFEVFAYES